MSGCYYCEEEEHITQVGEKLYVCDDCLDELLCKAAGGEVK
ncbi:hypothetical protein [Mechercharimyces sp. CAU 1602]|nr:hypothetical protein [Mechercharimyces sp. CAU 1602]MCS1351183.1 hypothetical protein [Mechercharimyces sp. CAU 1602]